MPSTQITNLNSASSFVNDDLMLLRKSGETEDKKLKASDLVKSIANLGIISLYVSAQADEGEYRVITLSPVSPGTIEIQTNAKICFDTIGSIENKKTKLKINGTNYILKDGYGNESITLGVPEFVVAIWDGNYFIKTSYVKQVIDSQSIYGGTGKTGNITLKLNNDFFKGDTPNSGILKITPSDDNISFSVPSAKKQDMLDNNSSSLAVVPAQLINHPGTAKALVHFLGANSEIKEKYNVESIVKTSTAIYNITFTNQFKSIFPFISFNYAGVFYSFRIIDGFKIEVSFKNINLVPFEPSDIYCIFFGELF